MLNREAVKHLGLISKYQWQIIRDPSLRSLDSTRRAQARAL